MDRSKASLGDGLVHHCSKAMQGELGAPGNQRNWQEWILLLQNSANCSEIGVATCKILQCSHRDSENIWKYGRGFQPNTHAAAIWSSVLTNRKNQKFPPYFLQGRPCIPSNYKKHQKTWKPPKNISGETAQTLYKDVARSTCNSWVGVSELEQLSFMGLLRQNWLSQVVEDSLANTYKTWHNLSGQTHRASFSSWLRISLQEPCVYWAPLLNLFLHDRGNRKRKKYPGKRP